MDLYEGQGGSYLLNPKTGKRKLLKRTEPATTSPTVTAPEDLSDGTADTEAPDLGR